MELKLIVESILFAAQKPMTPKEIRDVLKDAVEHDAENGSAADFKKAPLDNIHSALAEVAQDHEQAGRSYRLVCVAGAWQFVSQPEFSPWIKSLLGHRSRPPRLSHPALETLAIIAYRQPLTRAEIEQVRGVAVDGVMATLLERGLVQQIGRAEAPGRPITYGTTPAFLEYFGLSTLEDLPEADELRRVPIARPEALLTVEPGLATAPPESLGADSSAAASPQVESPASIPTTCTQSGGSACDVGPSSEAHSATETATEPAK